MILYEINNLFLKNKFLSVFLLLFSMSCDSSYKDKVKTIDSFPINGDLTSEAVDLENMPNCPRYLFVSGKYLTLLNFDGCDKYHIHVYDKNTLQFIGAFGTNGRGPNELFAPIPRNVVNNDTLSGI